MCYRRRSATIETGHINCKEIHIPLYSVRMEYIEFFQNIIYFIFLILNEFTCILFLPSLSPVSQHCFPAETPVDD